MLNKIIIKINIIIIPLMSSVPQQIQAYQVTINTSTFSDSNASIKEKTRRQLIPHYWKKFNMDRKRVVPSRQDRLSKLTTKQIDRIIDMEKIRSILYDKKRQVTEHYFQYDGSNPNIHSNIYQANFLARINEIAIKRNIRPESEASEDLGQDRLNKLKENKKMTKQSQVRVIIANAEQTLRTRKKKNKRESSAEDQKSIGEIQEDLDLFEEKLDQRRKRAATNGYRKSLKTEYKLIPSNRWFYGMSTHYLNKDKAVPQSKRSESYRSNYDIESELQESRHRVCSGSSAKRPQVSTRTSRSSSENRPSCPFQNFKTNRLVTLN